VPFEIVPPLKLEELTRYSVEADNSNRFGTSVFLFAMNKARYDALPEDLRAVIDANSGANIAGEMGRIWMEGELPGMELQEQSGGEIIRLDAATMAEFDARGETVVARWITEMQNTGIDGARLVEEARAAIARHSD